MQKGKQKQNLGTTLCCRNWSFSVRYFVSPALLLFFKDKSKTRNQPWKKRAFIASCDQIDDQSLSWGHFACAFFLPKKSILGIGKAEHRTSVSQETDELLLAMAMSPIYPSKQTAQLACLDSQRVNQYNLAVHYLTIPY